MEYVLAGLAAIVAAVAWLAHRFDEKLREEERLEQARFERSAASVTKALKERSKKGDRT